jgi:hypothetical protein
VPPDRSGAPSGTDDVHPGGGGQPGDRAAAEAAGPGDR